MIPSASILRPALERLYVRCNRRDLVDPDPLATVYRFTDPADQEIAGLIAAALAFGGVRQIMASIDAVFQAFPHPHAHLRAWSPRSIRGRCAGFRHRYVDGEDLAGLLLGMRRLLGDHGSLGAAFAAHVQPAHATVLPALTAFAAALRQGRKNYLVPDPALGSACKRLHLYLRWMVRQDHVDLGLWRSVGAERLVVPIDTHMHRIALRLGFTRRRTADGKTALEVTEAFRALAPEDPTRYDFALTRLGIRNDLDAEGFFRSIERPR